ncbi:hypothetical protein B0H34DRAFT_796380 [Crassisporium funariophilum]|nr:hypothetical protein B0H34DRAFT_796380 [Crassisporium funariophilum]
MLCPEFRNFLAQYDICILQESHLYPEEHGSLHPMNGHEIASIPRKYKRIFKKQYGGVVAIYKTACKVKINKLSSTDIMVIELDNLIVVNAYILPEYQTWDSFADVDPFVCLEEILTALREDPRPILLMGDLNARTGTCNITTQTRTSADATVSTQGRALVRKLAELDLIIYNGLVKFGTASGYAMSF